VPLELYPYVRVKLSGVVIVLRRLPLYVKFSERQLLAATASSVFESMATAQLLCVPDHRSAYFAEEDRRHRSFER
jgi:hypothetical protein